MWAGLAEGMGGSGLARAGTGECLRLGAWLPGLAGTCPSWRMNPSLEPWGPGTPLHWVGELKGKWGVQAGASTHRRFCRICQSCCRLHLRQPEAAQQWTPCREAGPCGERSPRVRREGGPCSQLPPSPHPPHLVSGSSLEKQQQWEHRQMPPRIASKEALQPR